LRFDPERVSQVSYVYVGWSDWRNVRQRYLDGGYVQLGASDWEDSFGVPLREGAIDYARFIGADAVVYTATSQFDSDPRHNQVTSP
jgi:hypothetical protein